MACYTFTGILACTYLGCCGAVATWQDMAAKAVPTALGALWALALTALVLPRYSSNAMLAQQAGIMRDIFRMLCRCVLGGMQWRVLGAAGRNSGAGAAPNRWPRCPRPVPLHHPAPAPPRPRAASAMRWWRRHGSGAPPRWGHALLSCRTRWLASLRWAPSWAPRR